MLWKSCSFVTVVVDLWSISWSSINYKIYRNIENIEEWHHSIVCLFLLISTHYSISLNLARLGAGACFKGYWLKSLSASSVSFEASFILTCVFATMFTVGRVSVVDLEGLRRRVGVGERPERPHLCAWTVTHHDGLWTTWCCLQRHWFRWCFVTLEYRK